MNANDVIGKCLEAKQTINIRKRASLSSEVIGQVAPGQIVGPVYSWVERDGYIWWMFDYTIPGNAPGAYWVAQVPGGFKLRDCMGSTESVNVNKKDDDVNILETSLRWFQWAIIGVVGILIFKK